MPPKKQAAFQPSGEINRVVSLGGGTYAYVFDHLGKTHHLKRNSDEMVSVCIEVDDVFNGKILNRLKEMGWDDVVQKIQETKKAQDG